MDVLGQDALAQPLHIQLLDHDEIIVAHQPRTRLMKVIGAPSTHCRVATGHLQARVAAAM
jgi:hypothetical protein